MRIENAQSGMILAQDVLDDYGNLLLEKGIALTESYIDRLKRLGIRTLWVEDTQADALKNPAISPELRTELTLCFEALFNLSASNILTNKLRTMYFMQISNAADTAISQVENNMPRIMDVQIRQPGFDDVTHAVNVCLLSLITGIYLKLPRSILNDLAMGALLHDLGKSVIPSIKHPGIDQAPLHALYGEKLLANDKQNYAVCRIAAEHHEAYDGSGFPARLSGKNIHPLARIVAIANYYDNARNMALKNGTARQDVVEDMMSKGNTQFDLNLLRAFFHTIALYPVGSLVRLSSGQTGYVVKNHAHYPLRPLIRVATATGYTDINLMHKPSTTVVELIKE